MAEALYRNLSHTPYPTSEFMFLINLSGANGAAGCTDTTNKDGFCTIFTMDDALEAYGRATEMVGYCVWNGILMA